MADLAIVEYTGEPVRLQSARIPQTLWEDRKAQIIGLFENHTLSEVIEKMAEDGFKASRRQYIHRLGQWGITKYKANQGKTSNANDVTNGKRKHVINGVMSGDDQDDTPSSTSPSCPLSSSKRLRVAVERAFGPDGNAAEEPMVDRPEQPLATIGTKDTATAGDVSEFNSGSPESSKSAADEFWAFVYSSKSYWTAGKGNFRIAFEVSRLARIYRTQPSKNPVSHNISDDMKAYLNDIGDYLWGVKRGEDAFDLYALMLETGDSHSMEEDVETLLYCAQSAEGPETCQWVLSLLMKYNTRSFAPSVACDVSQLAHLILMEKFIRYGLHDNIEYCAKMAFYLRQHDHSVPITSIDGVRERILNSIQNLYWKHTTEMPESMSIWISLSKVRFWYSQLFNTVLLKSGLINTLKVLKENAQDTMESHTTGSEEKEGEEGSLSSGIFQLLWHIKSKERQPFALGEKENLFSIQKKFKVPMPDFVGTCCGFLARIIMLYHQGASISDFLTGSHSFGIAELIDFVDLMEDWDFHLKFMRSYWTRNTLSQDLFEFNADELQEELGSFSSSMGDSAKPEPESAQLHEFAQGECRAGSTAGGGTFSSEQVMPPLALPRSVPRRSVGVKNYSLNPVLGSSCRSSLASYGQMIEARAAMARSQRQAKQKKTVKGSGGSLPSAGLGMDELGVSMGKVAATVPHPAHLTPLAADVEGLGAGPVPRIASNQFVEEEVVQVARLSVGHGYDASFVEEDINILVGMSGIVSTT
ncbi:hypothetical protein PG999_012249 [Apiospora kogelbergensis]|uniref:Clr5 domain-containing protein n=1 Tax=Apiospora kogelbergensis TaxID=1337665 RepID=A0AAW0QFG0_9PEZI